MRMLSGFRRWTCGAVFALLLLGPCSHAKAIDLIELAQQILDAAVHQPVPDAIAPLVQIAENADSVAVAALEIWCGKRERELLVELASANGSAAIDIERKLKAIGELKSALDRIKAKRQAAEKKKKEDSWDPFYARYALVGAPAFPGTNSFVLLADGAEDLPGDLPPGPIVGLVTPPWAGSVNPLIPVLSSSSTATFSLTANPAVMSISLGAFAQTIGSFDLLPGMATGINTASLNEYGSPPKGQLTMAGLQVELLFEGKYVNSIHNGPSPILFFASAHGLLKPPGAVIVADDPMIVPMPMSVAPSGEPWLRGAATIRFDAGTGTVILGENTDVAFNPDLAMVRDCEKRHTYLPTEDSANGAVVVLAPMFYTGVSGTSHVFADTAFSITKGANVLMTGFVRSIALDPVAHIWEGTLDISSVMTGGGGSRVANQIAAAAGAKRFAIAGGGTVVDMLEVTATFTTSGSMPWPDIFAIEAKGGHNCPSDLNGDGFVDDADFVLFAGNYDQLLVPPASRFADLNGDGQVDDADFVLFAAAYNELLCP